MQLCLSDMEYDSSSKRCSIRLLIDRSLVCLGVKCILNLSLTAAPHKLNSASSGRKLNTNWDTNYIEINKKWRLCIYFPSPCSWPCNLALAGFSALPVRISMHMLKFQVWILIYFPFMWCCCSIRVVWSMYSPKISLMVSCIAILGGNMVVDAVLIDRDITTVVDIRSRTLLAIFSSIK